MRGVASIVLICVAIALVSGCGKKEGYVDSPSSARPAGHRTESLVIYTDDATGCQYLTVNGGYPLTPRLNREGAPICGGAKP